MKSGIYLISHPASGRCYVGSAVDILARWRVHRCELGKGNHHSPPMQRCWAKYGPDAFKFEVLERVPAKEDLVSREQAWIDFLAPEFNCRPIAGSQLGFKHSVESRARISQVQLGRKVSEETRRKMSTAHAGYRHTDEAKQKVSAARKRRTHAPISDETRARMASASRGRVFTEQHRQRLSESNKRTWAMKQQELKR